MNHNTKLFRALIAAVLGSALLFGCEGEDDVVLPDGEVVSFEDLDANGDGFVSDEEWNAFHDTWDLNADGEIERREWRLPTPFNEVDTNRDGTIDRAEYEDAFTTLDHDDDQQLSPGEVFLGR